MEQEEAWWFSRLQYQMNKSVRSVNDQKNNQMHYLNIAQAVSARIQSSRNDDNIIRIIVSWNVK